MSRALVTTLALIASISTLGAQKREAPQRGPRFEITVPPTVRGEAVTGRVYVMVARDNDREPRLQIGRTGTPFFGRLRAARQCST